MNYTELVAAIESYTENKYTKDDVDRFIQNAEQTIYNAVQLPDLRKNVMGTMTANNKYFSLPSDWLSTFSIALINGSNEYVYLLNKDVNFIREACPQVGVTGEPKFYAIFDEDTMILGPTPNADYMAELHYYYYPESIVTVDNTWLGDNFDTALFYGSLLEAAAFMKEDADTVGQYSSRYQEAMALLQNLGEGKNRRDAYRSGQERIPVR